MLGVDVVCVLYYDNTVSLGQYAGLSKVLNEMKISVEVSRS